MKILYITPFIQHPLMKTSFRHYYFIRELAKRHDITLLTPTKSPVPTAVLAELRSQATKVVIVDAVRPARKRRHRFLRPLLEAGRKAQQMVRQRKLIRHMRKVFLGLVRSERFDVVVFHGHTIFGVIDGWKGVPLVLDVCDATSTRIRGRMRHATIHTRALHWVRYLVARGVERRMVRSSPHVIFISRRDRDAVLGPVSRALVIPNAVDAAYWRRAVPTPGAFTLVFHGGMDYRPNADAALHLIRQIFPRLLEARPDVRLLIVGRDPLPELLDATAAMPHVTVTGAVRDVRPYLERATIYVAPLRFGAGQQNKLLEAMAMEVPVVTSANGADGLRVGAEEPPVLIEDDPDGFAAAVLRLMGDETERKQLGEAGRKYICEFFSVARSARILEDACIAAAETASSVEASQERMCAE